MKKQLNARKITVFVIVTVANVFLARYAALSLSNVPGVVTFYFAVAFMIVFALWFGVWGALAAYIGCVIGAGIPAGLPLTVNLYWSLADLWQVVIPMGAFALLRANVGIRSKRDFAVFVLFGLILNNLAGALWGSAVFVWSGHFSETEFFSLFLNWFLGNMAVTLPITPLILRLLTPTIKKYGI
ncbi:MAG: MASE1 domain-containing protein [Candidatus Bathyarchaeota archaeon]|nr:MASE1 domain-containing protein [Candidatus Bathyarchaeota archaeon]